MHYDKASAQKRPQPKARATGHAPPSPVPRTLRRTAEPSEIADAVVYLASNRASYITGAVVAMDGAVTPMVV